MLFNILQNQAVLNLHGFKYVYKPRTINVSFSQWITRAWRCISPVKCFKKCCISTAVVGTDDDMVCPNKKAKSVLLGNRVVEFCELHIAWFLAYSGNHIHTHLCWDAVQCHVQLVKKAPVERDFLFWGLAVWRRLQMKSITCKVKNKVVPDSNFVAVLKF